MQALTLTTRRRSNEPHLQDQLLNPSPAQIATLSIPASDSAEKQLAIIHTAAIGRHAPTWKSIVEGFIHLLGFKATTTSEEAGEGGEVGTGRKEKQKRDKLKSIMRWRKEGCGMGRRGVKGSLPRVKVVFVDGEEGGEEEREGKEEQGVEKSVRFEEVVDVFIVEPWVREMDDGDGEERYA